MKRIQNMMLLMMVTMIPASCSSISDKSSPTSSQTTASPKAQTVAGPRPPEEKGIVINAIDLAKAYTTAVFARMRSRS